MLNYNKFDIIFLVISVKKNAVLFFFLILCICGCGNKKQIDQYADFDHFDLKNKNINSYTFHYDDNIETYAIADITLERHDEGGINGLFYKIDDNDYILLDEIESCGNQDDLYKYERYNYFYSDDKNNQNKLFINRCLGGLLLEYTLEGENFQKKVLKFDTSNISNNPLEYVMIDYIEKVDTQNIYYNANIRNTDKFDITIKCSLSNYECELIEN